MKTEAAVLWGPGRTWEIEPVELDPPKEHEVLVRMVASGLCHSDEHFLTGDMPFLGSMIGGHEGSGVVEDVVASFLPPCGHCPSCIDGHQGLCDMGMHIADGWQVTDKTARHHAKGQDLRIFCMLWR